MVNRKTKKKGLKKCGGCGKLVASYSYGDYCDACGHEVWDRGFESTTDHAEEIGRGQEIEKLLDKGFQKWENKRKKLARSKEFTKDIVTRLIHLELNYRLEKGKRLNQLIAEGLVDRNEIYDWQFKSYGYGLWWDDESSAVLEKIEDFEVRKVEKWFEITAECIMIRGSTTQKVTLEVLVEPETVIRQREFEISIRAYNGTRL